MSLACHELTLARGKRTILSNLSVQFKSGEWTVLVGPNGCGKSTWLQGLAGLLPLVHGEISIEGQSLANLSLRARAKALAWLGQGNHVSGDLLAWDVVMLARIPHHGLFEEPSAADEQCVRDALYETEAYEFSCRRIQSLSGGERQRVLLARLLAQQAPILLLDEPLVHLDPPHQRQLLTALKRRAAAGATVVTVLHELTQALQADRLLVLGAKGLVADGPPADTVVQQALLAVFDGSFSIERVADGRLVAIPN